VHLPTEAFHETILLDPEGSRYLIARLVTRADYETPGCAQDGFPTLCKVPSFNALVSLEMPTAY